MLVIGVIMLLILSAITFSDEARSSAGSPGFRRFAPTSPAACGGLCKRARKSTIELTRGAFSCSFAVRGGFFAEAQRLPVGPDWLNCMRSIKLHVFIKKKETIELIVSFKL